MLAAVTLLSSLAFTAPDPYAEAMASARLVIEQADAALAARKPDEAWSLYKEASALVLDNEKLRKKMLDKRAAAAKAAARDDDIAALARHDATLKTFLATARVQGDDAKSAAEKALRDARDAFDADGDKVRAAWAIAILARLQIWSGDTEEGVAAAKQVLDATPPFPLHVRKPALQAAYRGSRFLNNTDDEARFALMLDALSFEKLPLERRRFARSRDAETACARYEEEHGPGQCARLSKEVTGEYTFRDWRRGVPRKQLSDGDIDAAQAQYLPLLEDCLRQTADEARAKNSDLFQDAEVEIEWVVDGKGRALDPKVTPARYADILMTCVSDHLAWFRYPRARFDERKTVAVSYHLGHGEKRRAQW